MWVSTTNPKVKVNMELAAVVEEVHTPICTAPTLTLARDLYAHRTFRNIPIQEYCAALLGTTEEAFDAKAKLEYQKDKDIYREGHRTTWTVFINGTPYSLPEDPLINY